jgi:hypothetical protein
LAAKGQLEYVTLRENDDVQSWISGFLQLESSGWKGKEGSALASHDADRLFFSAVATAAFQRGRLLMLALLVNNKAIAYRCSLLAGPGSFSFKIAFDEAYARFAPGVLLHLENVRYLHSRPEIRWMDSCTSPDNSMLNHLWPDRRAMTTLVVGAGRGSGDLVVALMPLVRWLKRKLFGIRSKPGAWFDEKNVCSSSRKCGAVATIPPGLGEAGWRVARAKRFL